MNLDKPRPERHYGDWQKETAARKEDAIEAAIALRYAILRWLTEWKGHRGLNYDASEEVCEVLALAEEKSSLTLRTRVGVLDELMEAREQAQELAMFAKEVIRLHDNSKMEELYHHIQDTQRFNGAFNEALNEHTP